MMPTSDVSARVAWADDAAAIAAVQVRAWRTSYVDLLPGEVLAALEVEEIADVWRTALSRPADARQRVLVALERNLVTGFVVTGPATDPDCDPLATGEMADLLVDPHKRGAGHGSRLLQAAADTLTGGPVHACGDLAAGRGRRPARVPHRGRLGSRRRPPDPRPRR